VPAALVMATTRSVLRGVARRHASPGAALARANDILSAEIPPHMFVTCFYAVLDPASGQLRFANAGHDWPLRRGASATGELRARGMPLGLMAGMTYEENEIVIEIGDCVLLYSDGIVEAHDPAGQLLGFDQLQEWVTALPCGEDFIPALLHRLSEFTGPAWEQEDDITVVTIERALEAPDARPRLLCKFGVPSTPGNERIVMARVVEAVRELDLPGARLEDLRTAAAEATMNAIEYGNHNNPDLTITVEVWASDTQVRVRITDQVAGETIPAFTAPDMEAKLAGRQSPRGWGLFLIRNMVDDLRFSRDPATRFLTTELILNRTMSSKEANPA
jgi:anti-sigma regulatory factor (Ser/Thr protein kinase)